jgi:hypothetical protein
MSDNHTHAYIYGLCRCGIKAQVDKCGHSMWVIEDTSYSGDIHWCQQCGTKLTDQAIDQRDNDIWARNRAALGLDSHQKPHV